MQGIVDTTPELKTIIEKIARSDASCAVNEDHFDVVLGETRNFLFELVLGAISLDEYGWAMEKYLHHGSAAVYNACKLPTQEQNSVAIGLLTGVTTIIPVTTWAQHINTIWTHIEVSGIDAATLAASKAMIHERPRNECLKFHEILTMFPSDKVVVQPFVNSIRSNASFEACKKAAERIKDALDQPEASQLLLVNAAIKPLFNFVSNYIPPSDEEYTKGVSSTLSDQLEIAKTSEDKTLVVIEDVTKEKLDDKTRKEAFSGMPTECIYKADGNVAGELWEYRENVMILVTPSLHCIKGDNHKLDTRLRIGNDKLAIMSVLENANINPAGSTQKERRILQSFFKGIEGYDGDLAVGVVAGSFYTARRLASPNGFFKPSVCAGVRALRHLISSRVDMSDLHVPSLLVLLGYDNFVTMLQVLGVVENEPQSRASHGRSKIENESLDLLTI